MFTVDFVGCGALNWDYFFEINDLNSLCYGNYSLVPGREIALSENEFENFFSFLKRKAKLVTSLHGGSSANTIYALAKWGFQTGFIGGVGEDEEGEKILDAFKEKGIDISFVFKKGKTSKAIIIIDKHKNRFIAVCPGSAESFLLEQKSKIKQSLINNFSKHTIFHFTSFASETGFEFQIDILKALSQKISFDPGEIYALKGKEKLLPFFKKTFLLFITDTELEILNENISTFLEMGINTICLKQGKRGASFYQKGKIGVMSAILVDKVVDNTGAGDYFNAGVLAGLKLKLPMEKALELGCYVASMSLKAYGSLSLPSKREFEKLVSLVK